MAEDWDEIGFVISSQYRIAVLKRLADGPATPSRIAEDSGIGITHVSRALGRLRERALSSCSSPKSARRDGSTVLPDAVRSSGIKYRQRTSSTETVCWRRLASTAHRAAVETVTSYNEPYQQSTLFGRAQSVKTVSDSATDWRAHTNAWCS